jgi:S1-C subfamily serine protease
VLAIGNPLGLKGGVTAGEVVGIQTANATVSEDARSIGVGFAISNQTGLRLDLGR